jgi:hypothetical protein
MKRHFHYVVLTAVVFTVFILYSIPCCGQATSNPLVNQAMLRRSGPERHLNSIAFGNGIFVAVGFNRAILVSKDGTNWLERSEALEISTIGVNFTTETFAAGGQTLTLVFPSEGANQTDVHRNPFQFRSVGFGNGKFVIVGDSGEIHVSSNGENWRLANTSTSANLNGIACGDGKFVAVGDGGTILSSPDAVNWTQQNSGTSNRLWAVAYGNKTFTAVGGDMDNSVILTSADGINWTPNDVNRLCPIGAITFGNGEFMASAGSGYGLTMVSPDGKTWRDVIHPSSAVIALAYGQGRFIAVEAWEQPSSSIDGTDWKPAFAERKYGFHFSGATYGNGNYVAVGVGVLAVSGDGIHWQNINPPPSKLLRGQIMDSQVFFPFFQPTAGNTLGPRPLRPISKDGQIWQTWWRIPISGNVTDGETRFLRRKKDAEYAVLYSEDGITWARLQPITSPQPQPAVATIVVPNTNSSTTTDVSSVGIEFQLNGNSYKLNLSAMVGQIYQVQASTDLEHWQTLTMLTNNGTVFSFTDQDVAKYPQRFYRLKLQP